MFLRRLIYLLFLGVFTCLFVLACSRNFDQSATSSKHLLEECRVVQHAMGETCVPKTPQRLVALNAATLGNAIALGIKPVGSTLEYDNKFPTYLKGKTAGIEPLGNAQPSIERITLLQPDIIMSWKHNHESIYPQLSNIAPTAFYDWLGNNAKQDNWKEYFNFMAEVLNRKEVGQQVWQHYNQRIEKLKTALGDRYKNKTISFVIFCCGGIHSETENSFVGSVLRDAGLQRPESQSFNPKGYINFSEETLEIADGDVMFVAVYGANETGKRDLSILQKKPLWKTLKAVQQNRVYYVDPTIWRARTPLAADAVIDNLFEYLVNTP
ncbi:iron-siderophore ABC transporter substrate-binding protein [Gloeocapsopsis crepidinum LEGE 06123]|uniref:Iron-siderophore ABC transporter substrate-binding protein n=2 Tax=Gloeocapsopsis crepidinum TaxID=693223 RepID=A0ABR9UWN4_9CHRO|nr:iron-siderophore ABC transporter substrate-binding protein [Gloeocapsopsis crepidinum LEGE 06123]